MATFRATRLMRFGDCDPSATAYFPRYMDLLNGVVEDWWASLGLPWRRIVVERRIGVPTVHLDVDFKVPALMGDELLFTLAVAKIGTRSLTLSHTVTRDDTLLWRATQVVVATSLETHTSIRWPADIRVALERFMEPPDAHDPAA